MPRKKKPSVGTAPPHGITQWLGDTPLPPADATLPLDTHLLTTELPSTQHVAEVRIDTKNTAQDSAPQAQHGTTAQTKDGQAQTKAEPEGDTATAVLEVPGSSPHARESRSQASNRWTLEGRRDEVERFRDEVRKACLAKGMPRYEANEHAWSSALATYPAGETRAPPAESESPESPAPVRGLYLVPSEWPPLTDNASLQAELGWVQSQRLSIVEERGNSVVVHLERATSPAPSKAALGWLETSIRSYAKYVDVVARCLATAVDEQDATRRERLRIDDIRALLAEMHEDKE